MSLRLTIFAFLFQESSHIKTDTVVEIGKLQLAIRTYPLDNVVQLDVAVHDLIHVQEEQSDDGVFDHIQDEIEAAGFVVMVVKEQTVQARPSKLHKDILVVLRLSLLVGAVL